MSAQALVSPSEPLVPCWTAAAVSLRALGLSDQRCNRSSSLCRAAARHSDKQSACGILQCAQADHHVNHSLLRVWLDLPLWVVLATAATGRDAGAPCICDSIACAADRRPFVAVFPARIARGSGCVVAAGCKMRVKNCRDIDEHVVCG